MTESSDNLPDKNNFLTAKGKYLVDEIKFIQKIMSDSESIYSAWERWFLMVMAALISATILILKNENHAILILFVSFFGLAFSIMFALIQKGNHLYASARLERWKMIEELVKNEVPKEDQFYMQIISSQNEYLRRPENKWYKPPLTTWSVRKLYPVIFGAIWVVLLISAVIALCV